MGGKFDEIRQELDSLGYTQKLLPECVPLVQRLLADLTVTTKNLQKYMTISQQALEERDILESGAEPYKCDNAKLIRECNDLHLAFIHFREQHERIQRDLRNEVSALQTRLENCNLEKRGLMSQIQQLERDKYKKGPKSRRDGDQSNKENKKSFQLDSAMACADGKIAGLSKELRDLRDSQMKLVEDNASFKSQLVLRDNEIKRLQSLLDGGRSYDAVNKDCCYKNIDSTVGLLQDEISRLKRESNNFQAQIKDALAKQHEAMRRALHLAERNRQLEKEMKDIDEIALAVEAECNDTVKGNSEKVTRLQDRINESLVLIQNLERENAKLKQSKLELSADLEAIKLEKIHIKKQLDSEIDDKKRLNDRLNNFTIIENDLNLEIDRLTSLTAEQKRRIAELESQVGRPIERERARDTNKTNMNREESKMSAVKPSQTSKLKVTAKQKMEPKKTCKKKSLKNKSPTKSRSPEKYPEETSGENILKVAEQPQSCCCESGNCMKNLKELLDKEIEFRHASANQSWDALKQEKEYYMKEYHKVLEQMRNAPTHDRSDNFVDLKEQLKERDVLVRGLQSEVKQLSKEKFALASSSGQDVTEGNGNCNHPNCKRRERELDILRNDLKHIEMENNTFKSKLQALNETTLFNEDRMKKAFQDMEEHIRKLEDERRDLVKTEVTQRSNISHLEEEYKSVKEQLRLTQNELNSQKANYNQLKLLHEQTDRALSDAQNQALRAETELATYQARIKDTSRETAMHDKEVVKLNSDIQIMKNQLSKLDREKDDLLNKLDEKTEKIAALEDDLSSKNRAVSTLESELKELKRKLSKYADETSSQDHMVRSKQQELALLEQDYEKEKRLKEAALLENKRLQNDLASASCNCRDTRNELELCKRQVEDLKRQLQHYVAEVKRTEDLISGKELERNELLDQFRCLSQEANILENNNHTLETVANQSKIQLSVALDHTSELEQKIENQESIIQSYEKQITDLTSQVASLEVQLRQNNMEQEHFNAEMRQMRDLCVKLDKEKDNLKHELYNKDDWKTQIQKSSEKLRSEKESLQNALEKERNSLESVEKLLNEARQEVVDQRMLNQDLQKEVDRLKRNVDELQERLPKNKGNLTQSQQNSLRTQDNSKKQIPNAEQSNDALIPLKQLNAQEFPVSSSYLIDLTRLNKDNVDCHELCDKVKCPMHKKIFSIANDRSNSVGYSDKKVCVDDEKADKTCAGFQSERSKTTTEKLGSPSLHSTKTLNRQDNRVFHGSSGILHGVTDFTRNFDLNEPASKVIAPVQFDQRVDQNVVNNQKENQVKESMSVHSTKTLTGQDKKNFHGSSGILHGVLDFTELNGEHSPKKCNKTMCCVSALNKDKNNTVLKTTQIEVGKTKKNEATSKSLNTLMRTNEQIHVVNPHGKKNTSLKLHQENEGNNIEQSKKNRNFRKSPNGQNKSEKTNPLCPGLDETDKNRHEEILSEANNFCSKSICIAAETSQLKKPTKNSNDPSWKNHYISVADASKKVDSYSEKSSAVSPSTEETLSQPDCEQKYKKFNPKNSDGKNAKCMCSQCCSIMSLSEPNLGHKSSGRTTGKEGERCQKKCKVADKIKNSLKRVPKTTYLDDYAVPKNAKKTGKSSYFKKSTDGTDFSQDSDSSALFRKVFSIDGVGLECCCCISSYKQSLNDQSEK